MACLAISFLSVVTFFPLIVFSATDDGLPDRTVPETDIPSIVYRADTRSPDDIFQNGMRSLGNNDDLSSHLRGETCKYGTERPSAFISTTADRNEAQKHINKFLKAKGNEKVDKMHIYEITPSENFFSTKHSMLHMLDKKKSQDPEAQGIRESEDLISAQEQIKEWVAKDSISNTQIKSSMTYKRPEPGRRIQFNPEVEAAALLTRLSNDNYLPTEPTASNQPYNSELRTQNAIETMINAVVTFGRGILSTCTLACTRRSQSTTPSPESRKNTIVEDIGCITPISAALDLAEEELPVWDVVLNEVILKLVPWLQIVRDEDNHKISCPAECTMDVGEEDEHTLKVRCDNTHNLYSRFYVSLFAYRSGWFVSWSDRVKDKKEVNVGEDWEIKDTDIFSTEGRYGIKFPLNNGHNRLFTVAGVFRTGDDWERSEIRVLPIYPE